MKKLLVLAACASVVTLLAIITNTETAGDLADDWWLDVWA